MTATPNADTLTAARDYLRHGFSIVPLLPRTKRPAVKIEAFLSGDRRMNEDDARTFWSAKPDHGIAIVTGRPSGLVVLDSDPRHGADNEALLRDCTTGRVVQTGGSLPGLHAYCRHPGGEVRCGKSSRAGVDRKGDGGYVVAPPSLHPDTGAPYLWLREGDQLGDLPLWALEPSSTGRDGRDGGGEVREPWIAETLAQPENVVPGTQEETLTKLCWWAVARLPRDIALSTVWLWLSRVPLGDRNDPWTPEHVREKLERAAEKQKREKEHTAPLFRTRTLAELERVVMTRVEEPWLCEDWVPARGPFMVAGPSHVGKTWLMLDLAVSVAMGRPFLSVYPVQQDSVLFVAGEDDDRLLVSRLGAVWAAKLTPGDYPAENREDWIAPPPSLPEGIHLHTEGGFRFGDESREAALLAAAHEIRPRLIVFDPFKDFVPPKELTEFMAGSVHHLRFVRRLRDELGCAIGVVHHTGKNEERALTSAGIQGNSMFVASFDTRWIVAKSGDRAGVLNRETKATAPLPFVSYTFDVGDGALGWTTEELSEQEAHALIRPTARPATDQKDETLCEVLRREGPISARKAAEAAHLGKDATLARLRRLKERGEAEETDAGWIAA